MAFVTMDDVPTWDIIDAFFTQSGGSDCAHALVRHQIESFNDFMDKKLVQIIQGFNPISVYHQYDADISDFRHKIYINVHNPMLTKPMYVAPDGTQTVMTPHMARMNNLTYASSLYVDVHVINEVTSLENGVIERKEQRLPNVCIGKIPIMVRSKACVLTQMPGVAEGGQDECRYDMGGYFIISGNEKVVISQDRISENHTLVFAPSGNSDGLVAEIRSIPDGVFLPPKTTVLHLSSKPNHMGRTIRMTASFLRSEIPLFLMFRALGIESDKDIIAHICLDVDNPIYRRIAQELVACADDAADVHTQDEALQVLLKMMGTTGTPKEYLEQPQRAMAILKNVIRQDFLSHVGPSGRRKALYLGYMVRKLLMIHLGLQAYDNRDSCMYKRIDTPGILYSTLFRQCYGKLIKDVRSQLVRELNTWRATGNLPSSIINTANAHCFFRTTVIEAGLRYALSTGNWGVKTVGCFQNIRQGVAQVLNRMSYLSTLSHLRRINTPMEKNGKLVQPRKLENTQFGMICPSECFDPETPILMWDGTIKAAKDIKVGDCLINDVGYPVKVKSTCSGFKGMYEIVPKKSNFMSHTVTDNHILTLKIKRYKSVVLDKGKPELLWFDKKEVQYKRKQFDNQGDLDAFQSALDDDNVIDITIEKYQSLPNSVRDNLYLFKCDGVNWERRDVALDPYTLGMWLGDGMSETAPLKKLLIKYGLVENKHIPLDYLVNDRNTRLAVLAGLIDANGHVRANGHEVRITQEEKNYRILYDTEFLARSLGFSCHMSDGTCAYSVNGEKRRRPCKRLTIAGPRLHEVPTILPRKKLLDNPISAKRCYLQSPFKLAQKGVQAYVGWQVEGSGRFLLGDFSTSHNTPEVGRASNTKHSSMAPLLETCDRCCMRKTAACLMNPLLVRL